MSQDFLTLLVKVFTIFGLLVGYIVNYALYDRPHHINWRLLLGLVTVLGVGIARLGYPRWLVMKGKLSETKEVLIRTSNFEEEAQLSLEKICKAALVLPISTGPLTVHEDR